MEIVSAATPRESVDTTPDAGDLLALDRQVCFALAVACPIRPAETVPILGHREIRIQAN